MVQRSDRPMPDALHNYESVLHDSHIEKKQRPPVYRTAFVFLVLGLNPQAILQEEYR